MTLSCRRRQGQLARPARIAAASFLVTLLVAGHPAAGESIDAAIGRFDDQAQDNLNLRGAGGRNLLRSLLRAARYNDDFSLYDPLLVPQANDTISEEYWFRVNQAIRMEGDNWKKTAGITDRSTTGAPEPWKRIFQASTKVKVMDSPAAVSQMGDWELATPQPFGEENGPSFEKQMGVVPYDMQIGARILYHLTAKTPDHPPPTQDNVDQQFSAQCPLVMFNDGVFIRPPTCGNMGDWVDVANKRAILRWDQSNSGGVYLGVDSRVTGSGSVKFAELREKMSLKTYIFELLNCVDVVRYVVEEQIIKVNQMAPHAHSTFLEHEVAQTQEAFFYKYVIKSPNGTELAATTLFRKDQDEINFTRVESAGLEGPVYAVGKRVGNWKGSGWRTCLHTKRGWDISFVSNNDKDNLTTLSTAQDLRVAAVATMTLMAFRDESTGYDGFQHTGQGHMYWILIRTILVILLILFLVSVCWVTLSRKAAGKKLKRLCFHFEQIMLPKRPMSVRQPILRPTY